MANRTRPNQILFFVSDDEKRIIQAKMAQLGTKNMGAYLRKMAIDGYIIKVDYSYGAHVGGFDPLQSGVFGIGLEEIVENTSVVQVLGDGDAKHSLRGIPFAKPGPLQNEDSPAHHQSDDSAQGQKAHPHRQPNRHGVEQEANLPGGAGCAAEPHQTESPQYSHRCTQVPVDDEDDRRHQQGNDGQHHSKAAGADG